MRFKSFHIGKLPARPDNDDVNESDNLAIQIADMEEHVNGKTKELEVTEQQLIELSSNLQRPVRGESGPPQPHGPLSELTIEPEDKMLETDEDIEDDTTSGEGEAALPVVEVIKAEAAAATGSVQETPDSEDDSSLADLFSQEEEEVNPLAALISSLPDVTPQELIDELREIKELMGEYHNYKE